MKQNKKFNIFSPHHKFFFKSIVLFLIISYNLSLFFIIVKKCTLSWVTIKIEQNYLSRKKVKTRLKNSEQNNTIQLHWRKLF